MLKTRWKNVLRKTAALVGAGAVIGALALATPVAAQAAPVAAPLTSTEAATAKQAADAQGIKALLAAAPDGCSYGVGGPSARTICWLDLSEMSQDQANSASGQPMHIDLGNGIQLTFNLRFTPQEMHSAPPCTATFPGREADVLAVPTWSGGTVADQSTIGNLDADGDKIYVGVGGKPALYPRPERYTTCWNSTATPAGLGQLTDIVVQRDGHVITDGYTFVMADAERTNTNEGFDWSSDQPIRLLKNIPVKVGGLEYAACRGELDGLGTTMVKCRGTDIDPWDPSQRTENAGAVVVAVEKPDFVSAQIYAGSPFSAQGVMFGVMFAQVGATKTIEGGRVDPGDQFEVSVADQEQIAAAETTGTNPTATTDLNTVLASSEGNVFTFAERGLNGTDLRKYTASWTCQRDDGQGEVAPGQDDASVNLVDVPADQITVTRNADGTSSASVVVKAGEVVVCNVTNTAIVPGLQIAKSADPASGSLVNPGQDITYTVNVTNTGNVALTPAKLDDNLANVLDNATYVGGSAAATIDGVAVAAPTVDETARTLHWEDTLPVGKTAVVTYTVKVNDNVTKDDVLTNVVTGSGDVPPGVTPPTPNCVVGSTDPNCSTTHTPADPSLEVKKSASPASGARVNPGQTVTYTVTVENTGNTQLAPAALDDNLADVLDNATYVDGSASASVGGTAVTAPTVDTAARTLHWEGTLEPGQIATITYAVTVNANVTQTDKLVNVVVGTGTNPGNPNVPVPSNCVLNPPTVSADCSTNHQPAVPGLAVKKSATPASGERVNPGDEVTYTVTVENTGNTQLAPAVLDDNLADVLDNATYVADSATASVDGTVVTAPTVDATARTLQWSGTLEPGQIATLTYSVKVNANVTQTDKLVNVVVGTGTTPDNPTVPVPSNCESNPQTVNPDCSTNHQPAVPGLAVHKSATPASGARVNPGQEVTYTVTVENTGNTQLAPASIADDLSDVLDNATYVDGSAAATIDGVDGVAVPEVAGTTLTWSNTLEVGQTATLTYTVKVNENVTQTDKLVNVVVGTGTNPENPDVPVPSNCAPVADGETPSADCSTNHQPAVPGLAVKKSADPASGSQVVAGQTITYTVTVENTGNTQLAPASITDDLSDVLDNATYVDGSAAATIDGVDGVAVPEVAGTTLTWSNTLEVGQTATLTYQVTVNADVTQADKLVNVVVGTGTNPENPNNPNVPSNCVPDAEGENADCSTNHTPSEAGIRILKSADPVSGSRVDPGQTITYSVTVENTGNVALTPAKLDDDLSDVLDNATYVDGSAAASINGAAAAAPVVTGTSLHWEDTLPVGATAVVTYRVTVNSDVKQTDALVNVVTGSGDVPPGVTPPVSNCAAPAAADNPDCTTTHTPNEAGIVVKKSADPVSGSRVNPGDVVTYTVTVANTGNIDLTPAKLDDNLADVLDNATYVDGSATASIGGTPAAAPVVSGTELRWEDTLPAGATATLTYQVKVNADVTQNDRLVNVVTGSADVPPGATPPVSNCVPGTENPDCTTTHTPNEAGIAVQKTADPVSGTKVKPGQTVTYSVTVTNTGNVDLTPAKLDDDLSDVLDNATYVADSAVATIDGNPAAAPVVSGTSLHWEDTLKVGQAAVLTYQVKVKDNATSSDKLVNVVVGSADVPPGVTPPVSNCVAGGTAPECTTAHPVDKPLPATGGSLPMLALFGGLIALLLGGSAVLVARAKRKEETV